jgi:plastocyanin
VLAATAALVAPCPAASADVVEVRLTQDGPVPVRLVIATGDVVRFVNTDTFPHHVVGDPPGWGFDSGTLLPGRSFEVSPALVGPGRYAYRGVDLDRFGGTVVVPGPEGVEAAAASPAAPVRPRPASASPTPSPSVAPAGSPSPSAVPSPLPSPSPGVVAGGPPPTTGSDAQGGLRSPVPARHRGLPVAVALVLLVTAVTLLLRVLSAEVARAGRGPAAR